MEPNLSPRKYLDPISYDGVRDSLTQLASPKFFYDSLTRECARSDRNSTPLTVVRFWLVEDRNPENQELQRSSDYEIAIINFSKIIDSYSRESDLSARMARFEFISLLNCREGDAAIFTKRVRESYLDQGFSARASSVCRVMEERALSLMRRLDMAPETNNY